jgi:hypothetical protein
MNSPFYELTGPWNLDFAGLHMSQSMVSVAAWGLAILQEKPKTVVEIGTGRGGFTRFLSECTSKYGGTLWSMDVENSIEYPLLGRAEFIVANCFERADMIESMIKTEGKTFLLCDGGNKEKEFNTFSRLLKPGDVIGAHDWINDRIPNFCPDYWSWSEVSEFNLNLSGLDDFMPEWFDKSAWFVRQKV